jgi:hypothetical protein
MKLHAKVINPRDSLCPCVFQPVGESLWDVATPDENMARAQIFLPPNPFNCGPKIHQELRID